MKMKFINRASTRKIRAVAKYVRMSSKKARRVAHQLRGCTYMEALSILNWMPYRACYPILKVLRSAAANAYSNMDIDKGSLFVLMAEVNEGPIFKRFRPRAQGRDYPIQKPTCHITITLEDVTDSNSIDLTYSN
uniref:Large ribosomal subunit protein uL22c n=1 Tax=Athrotaxis laxifolia TaxID=28976 RepID=A0A6J4AEB4_ATHLA|nr:ribosomal protein L22 [Athrotaxis laxifolia]BBN66371.1 ribosomal protein L22 [Athrotaxis laxifolia]